MTDKKLTQLNASTTVDFIYGELSGVSKKITTTNVVAQGGASVAASKLLGRGSAGGAGPAQEITLGTNLGMSGTTLNAIGGGTDSTPDWVNVKDFGAVGNNVTDDTAAIQAAIDYAASHGISTIYIPSGRYKVSATIELGDPSTAGQTLALVGDPGAQSHESTFCSQLCFTVNNITGVQVGPGQGMAVMDLAVIGPEDGVYRANKPSNGVGVGYIGNGTASRSLTQNVFVQEWYTAFKTGVTGDGLNDSNTWIKCTVFNCAIGAWIAQTQNFINSFYDCNFSASTGVLCANGGGAHIFGGNWSANSGQSAALACNTISAWTASAFGNTFSYVFTAVVTPDAYFTGPNGVYSAFVFPTTNFGLVPCDLTAFNSGTGVATFVPRQNWVEFNFGTNNIATVTDLVAEVQANTKVYCSEVATPFNGNNITVVGVHVENDFIPTQMLKSNVTFGGNRANILQQVFFNGDPGFEPYAPAHSPTDPHLAIYYVAHSFPFIWMIRASAYVHDCTFGIADPVIVDGTAPLTVERCEGFRLNYRATDGSGGGVMEFDSVPQLFDKLYFTSPGYWADGTRHSDSLALIPPQISPCWYFRPTAYGVPTISPANFATISGVLPGIGALAGGGDKVPYPLVWGGQVYGIGDFAITAQAAYRFISIHNYYSFGQDLTVAEIPAISWSYKGQSNAVYMSAETMAFMRPGMQITLNDGSSDVQYLVTAIYPGLGYVTVSTSSHGVGLTSGVKTNMYTGAVIKQEPFTITTIS